MVAATSPRTSSKTSKSSRKTSKSSRKAKPQSNHHESERIPRPRNAFILYRNDYVHGCPQALAFKKPEHEVADRRLQAGLSMEVSAVWNSMSDEDKQPWFTRQEQEKKNHTTRYPDYVYRPLSKKKKQMLKAKRKAGRGADDDNDDLLEVDAYDSTPAPAHHATTTPNYNATHGFAGCFIPNGPFGPEQCRLLGPYELQGQQAFIVYFLPSNTHWTPSNVAGPSSMVYNEPQAHFNAGYQALYNPQHHNLSDPSAYDLSSIDPQHLNLQMGYDNADMAFHQDWDGTLAQLNMN
ncbi:regulator of filamentous growth and virulence rfg1p [Moniliophthora roreri MCA 2997]|uniref:Regulator of filamentous growth and virulence rfg1p n=2 Tax=Moniliophthora roreri TaxID=221103 RepID=V2WYE4_MONRO|nr:regulator of filamentous growth and virulence rfg1p [Moniliophthora roreri MCA 2997]KAI3599215.1 regulator of filamentous growth and virulence rfg1p [Moniliophthora roreri]